MTALDWFLVVFGYVVVVFLICGGVHIGQVGRRRRPCEHDNTNECVADGCWGWRP